jgi:hypothetical protein
VGSITSAVNSRHSPAAGIRAMVTQGTCEKPTMTANATARADPAMPVSEPPQVWVYSILSVSDPPISNSLHILRRRPPPLRRNAISLYVPWQRLQVRWLIAMIRLIPASAMRPQSWGGASRLTKATMIGIAANTWQTIADSDIIFGPVVVCLLRSHAMKTHCHAMTTTTVSLKRK